LPFAAAVARASLMVPGPLSALLVRTMSATEEFLAHKKKKISNSNMRSFLLMNEVMVQEFITSFIWFL
jgi:hypothetical protein